MGKLKDHLTTLAFKAIDFNKPQFLEFCLSMLKVDENATILYEGLFPYPYGYGRRKARIDLVQYAVHRKKPECLEVVLQHWANVYPTVENYNNEKFAPPLNLAMDEERQEKRSGDYIEYVTSRYQILSLLLRYVG